MNDGEQAKFICPLYERRGKASIVCRSILPGSITTTHFKNYEDYQIWKNSYCKSWGYDRCPYYKIVEERNDYEDEI